MNTVSLPEKQTIPRILNQDLNNLGYWSVTSNGHQENYLLMRIAESFFRIEFNTFTNRYSLFFIESFDINSGNVKTLVSTSEPHQIFTAQEIIDKAFQHGEKRII